MRDDTELKRRAPKRQRGEKEGESNGSLKKETKAASQYLGRNRDGGESRNMRDRSDRKKPVGKIT